MQPKAAKTSAVTDALQYLVELNPTFTVDEEKFVIFQKNGERAKTGKSPDKPILLYQEHISTPDAVHILNPFAEGLGMTPASSWFYNILKKPLEVRFAILLRQIADAALEQQEANATNTTSKKKKTKGEEVEEAPHLPVEVLNLVSKVVDQVDSKMVKQELDDKFTERCSELVIMAYYKSTQTTKFQTDILDDPDSIASKFNLRKKTVAMLATIVKALFDVKSHDDLVEKYKSTAMENAPSRMSSYLSTMYKLYQRMNPILVGLNLQLAIKDMDAFKYHLDNLPAYTLNAKFMASPSTSSASGMPSQAPAQNKPTVGAVPQQQQMNNVPGPENQGMSNVPGPNNQGMSNVPGPQMSPRFAQSYMGQQQQSGFLIQNTTPQPAMGNVPGPAPAQQQYYSTYPQTGANSGQISAFAPQQPSNGVYNPQPNQQFVQSTSGIVSGQGSPYRW